MSEDSKLKTKERVICVFYRELVGGVRKHVMDCGMGNIMFI